MRARQTAEQVWTWLHSESLLAGLLMALGFLLLLSLLLPQTPVLPSSDAAAYLQWRAQIRPIYGAWEPLWAGLGFFSLRTSIWMRLVLALLGLSLIARLTTLWECRRCSRAQGAVLAGSLLILIGWGLQLGLGWTVVPVLSLPGQPLQLPQQGLSLAPVNGPRQFWTPYYGLYLFREGRGVQLDITAQSTEGAPLKLTTSAHDAPVEHLQLSLTAQAPETYFAIASEGLIFRITLRQPPPETRMQIQIYRSASGQLLVEAELQGNGDLHAQETRMHIENIPLEQFRAVFNPGAPLQGLGIALLAIGVLWIRRRPSFPRGSVSLGNDQTGGMKECDRLL